MTVRRHRAFLVVAFAGAWALAGCAEMSRRLTVSVDEFASYRRFRTAPTVESKLGASFDYLRQNPRGSYHDEVARWLHHTEVGYVVRAWDDPLRLRAFLSAVPLGPYASKAAERLVELELADEYRARYDRAFDLKVRRMEQGLAKAEAGRRELLHGIVAWARRLAAIRTWGRPLSDLDDDLLFAFRLDPPGARCKDEVCERTISIAYGIPEAGAQSARQAIYDVGMRLEHGGVRAAWLTGPDLFTRIGEAVRVSAVDPSDLGSRAEAIGQAAQMIALAVEPSLPFSRCAADAVSPVVVRRTCDGVDLRVITATELGEEDRIAIEPVATPDRLFQDSHVSPGGASPR
jgi:hypothetical protein